jgi:hypothetical protein
MKIGIKQLVDIDYWHKLSKEEKKYLLKFCSEYYYDFFNSGEYIKKNGENLHPKKMRKAHSKRVKEMKRDVFTWNKVVYSDD